MLGGGNFTIQNKTLPGTYINFISAKSIKSAVGERGTSAIGLELDFGEDNKIIEITAEQFEKDSVKLFGYDYSNEKLKGLRELFKNSTKALIFKLNAGGEKANNKYATAKYTGTRGNDLKIRIQKNIDDESKFDVSTILELKEIDKQTVSDSSELQDNDFVTFKKDSTLEVTAQTPLEGGTNGTTTGQSHQSFLNLLESYSFNALGCLSKEESIKKLYVTYTKRLRDTQGIKFQTVLYNETADYEGIINLKNNVIEDETALIYWVTGAIAGCAINASNSNKTYDGEYTINADYTQTQLENAIKDGEFVFHRVANEIRVLSDINSLVSVTTEKGEDFKSNQTIRVLDQSATDIATIFNNRYIGKIPNDEAGRISLWNDIVTLFKEYQTARAIENFNSEDITINTGNDKKSVVINNNMQPINCMEKLYVSVVIG